MNTYASPEDLAAAPWGLSVPEENAERLIGYASRLVRRATMSATYLVTPEGLPDDVGLRDAMRDAVCSQITTWSTLGVDPTAGDADGPKTVASKSFGGASITYAVAQGSVEARARAATTLSPDARLILEQAGLIGQPVGVQG